MRRIALVLVCALVTAISADASSQRGKRRTPPKPRPLPALKTEPAKIQCRESLGTGVRTMASYCFVQAGRDPAQGILVTLPPHNGPATLMFNLHNRHTFSEEEVKMGRGFARYTAGIGGLISTSMDHTDRRVPFLGKIPGLGRLFSSKNVDDVSTNLLIFITAKTVNADGASPEEVFDPRAISATGMVRDDLPGQRAAKSADVYANPASFK